MSIIDIIGFIPAIIFPAAALMQLVHLVRAKRSEGVSALSWSAFALGNLAMFVYAEKYFELQAVVGLLGTFVIQIIIIVLTLRYRSNTAYEPFHT